LKEGSQVAIARMCHWQRSGAKCLAGRRRISNLDRYYEKHYFLRFMAYDPYQTTRGEHRPQNPGYGYDNSRADYDDNPDFEHRQLPEGRSGGSIGGGLLQLLLKNPRVLMAVGVAAFGLISYLMMPNETNAITDETVKVPWGPEKDVPLGLQAAPQMMAQHGGEHPDARLQKYVDDVGMRLLKANAIGDWEKTFRQYKWDFHLLRDDRTINAFALPGGQVFFTMGLFSKLKTEDEVAGVLGHEIGHVIGRHSAQQMAKSKALGSVGTAATILTGSQQAGAVAAMMNMKYGRDHETQSDTLGVQFMINANYNPEGLIRVMEVLKASMGGQRQPEFMSTHPDPGNRVENIKLVIEKVRRGELEGPREVQSGADIFKRSRAEIEEEEQLRSYPQTSPRRSQQGYPWQQRPQSEPYIR
jgi:predicted Zn-dependent protease